MSKNRLVAILAILALLVAAVFTIGSGIAPAPSMPNRGVANQVAGSHPELVYSRTNVDPIALDTAGGADWFQRHPESLKAGNAVDLTDYYARHPGASIALNMASASDWFQRHPESLKPGNAVDLSDYYARHPGKEQDDLVTRRP